MYNVHLTTISSNAKTGPIPVSTTEASTCPPECPLKGSGCYAQSGPLGLHWSAVSSGRRGMAWADFCDSIAQLEPGALWRHNQAGDLPGQGSEIDPAALGELVRANTGKRGFTYTHKPPSSENLQWIRAANAWGFTVNLSANNLEHADQLMTTGAGPVVTLLPIDSRENLKTPAGHSVVICPAETREGVTCSNCQLCQRVNRSTIVGFPAHSPSKKKAQAVFFAKVERGAA